VNPPQETFKYWVYSGKHQMETVAAKLPKALADEVDRLIRSGRFSTRSDVLRTAVREFLGTSARKSRPGGGRGIERGDAFGRRLKALAAESRYRDRWVALHDDDVIDADDDKDALLSRVLERDEEPIYIGYATEKPEPVRVRLPGVRVPRRA